MMTQTDGILWAISDFLQAWFIVYKEDPVGRWSKNEDKGESNSTRVFTGMTETYIEWWKNSILGWRCDGTFLHLRHCSCKQLPGANAKQSDVGDWRSPWRFEVWSGSRMEFYPILGAEISLFLMGGFRCRVFAVYRLSGPQGYLIILLIIFYVGWNQGQSVKQETYWYFADEEASLYGIKRF
jgi:hypothetical protein